MANKNTRIDYFVADHMNVWLDSKHIKDGYHINGSIEEVQRRALKIAGHAKAASTIVVENVEDLADYIVENIDYKSLSKWYTVSAIEEKFTQRIPIGSFAYYKVCYNARFQMEELKASDIVLVFLRTNMSFKLLTIYPE